MYTNIKVNISEGQKEKLKRALREGTQLSIRLSHDDLVGEDVLAVTQTQLKKLQNALETGKGTTIKMSRAQVAHNMKVEGGFLSLLAGLAARALPLLATAAKTVLPHLATGALTGLASSGIQKLLGGGLYIKKGGCVCEVETDGKRLLLEPTNGKVLAKVGDGLYLKRQGKVYDGKGLLFGPDSPFKNIPILGMLL